MNHFKEIFQAFLQQPTVAFMMLTIAACYFLYTDLRLFIEQQQAVLNRQVEAQSATVDLLNQISQRITEIEIRLYGEAINK